MTIIRYCIYCAYPVRVAQQVYRVYALDVGHVECKCARANTLAGILDL